MFDNRTLNDGTKRELIQNIKNDIKKDDFLLNNIFFNREEFKDKLYIILTKKIQEKYPYLSYQVDDDLLNHALAEIFGLGLLEQYLQDKDITDIFIQDKEMIIIKNGRKEYLGEVFKTIEDVYLIIDRIKNRTGKTIDQRIPFLNTELYDGSRCSVVIPPAADRIYISIRVFNCIDFKLEDLLKLNMFDSARSDLLRKFVSEQKNILIVGAMGSGKTTLLNTLAKLIPKSEFISIIQDVPEIRLKEHPYVRQLSTRSKSREIDNEITQDKLLFETLRMKADRIILGEVRNSMAAYQMLQALNTGHKGSFGTIHADSAYDAFIRLETLTMEYKENIGNQVVRRMISRAIDVILYLEFEKDEDFNICNRKLKEIVIMDDELDKEGGYKLEYL
ncbi:MAG: Flp pilus assembly complex ATPase component TadA [Actinomycetia bacterium]|nr:Flp pilus assembly complex ATPase component TadA [Actinomycetes bacterium]